MKNTSFEIDSPGFYGILGNSGAGKTTLLNIILNLDKCDSGAVLFDFNPSFSAVFQENRLLHWLTIYDNIKLVSECEFTFNTAIKLAELPKNLLYKFPAELSGGEQRRVAIARAL
ncbi:MAG: ATP-binding cassette domain-containing protein, partial [Oscillospiraceae bacterium]|nr:ATP-binding cassette domain-containing protein [Oscillospiraceae bacterium]